MIGSFTLLTANPRLRELVKFGLVGLLTTAIYLGLFRLLIGLQIIYPIATAVAFFLATLNSYYFNRRWTFRAGAHRRSLLLKFFIIQLIGFSINLFVLAYLIEQAGFKTHNEKLVAALIANSFVVLTNFTGNKLWTFKR